MSRTNDRASIPIEHRVPLLERDADLLEEFLRSIEHNLSELKKENRASFEAIRDDIAETREDTNAKFNKALFAILGIALTVLGGIFTAVVSGALR